MSTQKFSSAIISVLMLASAVAPAQKTATHNDTWKKIVAREVNISEKPDEKQHHFHSPGTDTGITELIYDAVRSGKVIAYNAFDTRLVEKLTTKEIENPFSIPPDTQVIVDPITGIGKITITHADIDYDRFYKYRILEEWTFDRAAGNIGINIIAVAPMMDVYGASGDSRGSKMVFWVKYSEIAGLLKKYEQSHPGKSLANYIWDDYFLSDVKPAEQK